MGNARVGASVGIDLGTTYSLVAVLDEAHPRILNNSLGEGLTPSAVYVQDDGQVLVGRAALARWQVDPTRGAVAFKRDMGTDRRYILGKRVFSPVELSAVVLAQLKADAEAALGCPVDEAVVTVPAYFGEVQRRATQQAAELAGLHVERIVNEPTAAALAYGLQQKSAEQRAVVIDLGGGTFDVTVLEIMEGVVEIQASAGDTRLGGEDFLDALVEHVTRELQRRHGAKLESAAERAALRVACEAAKKRLSDEITTSVAFASLAGAHGPVDAIIELRRDDVEFLWLPLLDRLRAPIARALRDARAQPSDIDVVLLVGGATRMPQVARLAAELFGRVPSRELPPDEAVALGAAVQAALKRGDEAVGDLVVTDVAPFSLGIEVVETFGAGQQVNGVFSPILERGTVLPASRSGVYSTVEPHQTQVRISVYQGEHPLVANNTLLGTVVLRGFPPLPDRQSFQVRFTYDLNGVLEVDAVVDANGASAQAVIQRQGAHLDPKALRATRERLAKLKFHPREALPNVTALARADALYARLTGLERQFLTEAMASLRAALELQEPRQIELARRNLLAVVERLGR